MFHALVRRALAARSAALVSILVLAPAAAAQQIRTESEASGFSRHTSHANLVAFMQAIQAGSTEARIGRYGETREGRDLLYAVFSRPAVGGPAEALLSGKPIVLFSANVHGNERTFRESLLLLMREMASPGTPANAWLDDLIVLVVPTINPDGFEATERGTRGNMWGIDLNRDYVKLEQPTMAAYVGNLINRWHPHLVIDGHNGGSYPYNVNYQCTSNAAADARLTAICDDEIFPAIDRALERSGYSAWYYQRGDSTRWTVGGSDVRIGRNYGGLANSISILFESPGGQELSDGVRSGVIAYSAVADFVRANAGRVLDLVDDARRETIRLGENAEGGVVVQQRYGPEDRRVTYRIAVQGEGEERQVVTITSDSLMKQPIPARVRDRPFAYVLPRDAVDAVAMLRRHNIVVERLDSSVELEVQAYTLADVQYRSQYNHAATTIVTVGDVLNVRRSFPRGTYVVRTGQMLGRVVSHMLEPETNDNVVVWNTMDAWLPKAELHAVQARVAGGGRVGEDGADRRAAAEDPPLIPIFKVMRPTPLPTRIID